ncbi:MAG: DNA polymerase [Candidatus Methylacidiphilaceae bacterium]
MSTDTLKIDLTDAIHAIDFETYGGLNPYRPGTGIRLVAHRKSYVPPTVLVDVYDLATNHIADLSKMTQWRIVAHNALYELVWAAAKRRVFPKDVHCTFTAAKLLAGDGEACGLDAVQQRYLNIPPRPDKAAWQKVDWANALVMDDAIKYAADDVRYLPELHRVLQERLKEAGLTSLYEMERSLLPVVVKVIDNGFLVDDVKLAQIQTEAIRARDRAGAILAQFAPPKAYGSPKQMLAVLQALGLLLEDTSEGSLAEHRGHPAVDALLEWRAQEKLRQQAESYRKEICSDGRIHALYKPLSCASGRFSCAEPNLQQVARGKLREAFVAPPGKLLVIADYSQLELRIVAAIAGEKRMIEAFQAGRDLHQETADRVLGTKGSSKDARQIAKSLNFGLVFGMGAPAFQQYAKTNFNVDLTLDEAKSLRARFFKAYPAIAAWHESEKDSWDDWATTRLGRRRQVGDKLCARINHPVQGGAADGVKLALLDLDRALPAHSRIVALVHDEFVVETPEESAEEVAALTVYCMAYRMQKLYPECPIRADYSVGRSWGAKGQHSPAQEAAGATP